MNSPTATIDIDTLMARIRAEAAKRREKEDHSAGVPDNRGQGSPPAYCGEESLVHALSIPQLSKPRFVPAERYHLNDFLALHDEDFLDAAYRGVLKRGGDIQGRAHFLACLRDGTLSKIEILGRLRYSPEGRRQRVPIKGLLPAFAVQHAYRLPVVGGLVAFAVALVRLPRMARNLQGLEAYQHQRNAELEATIHKAAQGAEANERRLGSAISDGSAGIHAAAQQVLTARETVIAECRRLEAQHGEWRKWREQVDLQQSLAQSRYLAIAQRLEAGESRNEALERRVNDAEQRDGVLEQHIAPLKKNVEALDGRISEFESHKQNIDKQLVDVIELAQQTSVQLATSLRETLGALEQRMEGLGSTWEAAQTDARSAHLRLVERIARVEGRVHAQGLQQSPPQAAPVESVGESTASPVALTRFDRLYFAFEQRFRGTREEIRRRLTYYLPMVRDSVVGSEGATVLDVGCGRGEWLELLREEGIKARGIDINETMAKECRERGLEVSVGDAIAQLKQLPDNALGALTGFHIIEHIPLDSMIELIEEAHRVVQPGGLVIFETPNPENLVVGACNFYTDPTHQRPLPPPLTQFLVEAGGFVDVTVHRVNAELLPQVFPAPSESDSPALRGALDYLRGVFLSAPDYSVVGRVA